MRHPRPEASNRPNPDPDRFSRLLRAFLPSGRLLERVNGFAETIPSLSFASLYAGSPPRALPLGNPNGIRAPGLARYDPHWERKDQRGSVYRIKTLDLLPPHAIAMLENVEGGPPTFCAAGALMPVSGP